MKNRNRRRIKNKKSAPASSPVTAYQMQQAFNIIIHEGIPYFVAVLQRLADKLGAYEQRMKEKKESRT